MTFFAVGTKPVVVEAGIARRVALYALLARPDPPDLHRGNVLRLEGKPDRHQLLPQLAEAFVREKLREWSARAESTLKSQLSGLTET